MPRRDVLTERLAKLFGVDDGRTGLSSSEDAFVESRVESMVSVRVVGCSQRQDKASKQASTREKVHGSSARVCSNADPGCSMQKTYSWLGEA